MWQKFPLIGGAVNNREPNALRAGEFSAASGVRYKPNDEQLHSDLNYTEWQFRLQELGADLSGWQGPFYLSFEDKRDWVLVLANQRTGIETVTVKTRLYFTRANGQTGWVLSDYALSDNSENQNGITAAKVRHWGDRYYLLSDQGIAEIIPPTGATGIPTLRKLGMPAPEATGPLYIGGAVSNVLTGNSTSFAFSGSAGGDLVTNDIITVYITEYDSTTALESPILWKIGTLLTESGDAYAVQAGAAGKAIDITLPDNLYSDNADKLRVYLKFWGNGADTEFGWTNFNDINAYRGAVVGANLLLDTDGNSEHDPGASVQFADFQKDIVVSPLPVIPVDDARLIFPGQRMPNTATAGVFWNDSLVANDTGYSERLIITDPAASSNLGRVEDARKTIIRYSPAGNPGDQPTPFVLPFASDREDQIKGLEVVNDRLMVLCDQAVHTVRYLPYNNLLSAQQGRVNDVLTTNVGLASPNAVVKVETNRGEMCVWLSRRGLEWSDGLGWDDACPDFSVPDGVDPSDAAMVVLPNEYRVDLYLGLNLYSFYYHPSHLKNGRLKMLGPTVLNAQIFGACEYRGTVYRFDGVDLEWTGVAEPGGEGEVYTGQIHAGNVAEGGSPFKDIRIKDFGVTHGVADSVSLQVNAAVTGYALENGPETFLDNPDLEETGSAGVSARGNYLRLLLRADRTDADWAVGPLWLNGSEESGGNG